MQEITERNEQNILHHPYLALLHKMNIKYGAKFQLNMFYSYEPDGFSLAQVPSKFKSQFERLEPWLRLSFHAANNEPPFPYEAATPQRLLHDYTAVQNQLLRIAGQTLLTNTTTLHYVTATSEAMCLLRENGVKAFIGMFYPQKYPQGLSYYLNNEQCDILREKDFYYDLQSDITFARNHLVINKFSTTHLEKALPLLCERSFVQLMTHEQYFYNDYVQYQADYAKKMERCFQILTKAGYKSVFLHELL